MRTTTISVKPDQLKSYIHEAVLAALDEWHDPDFGLELHPQIKKRLAQSERDLKAGRVYTLSCVQANRTIVMIV